MAIGKNIVKSFYFFVRPSFLEGIGRIFDSSNALSVYRHSGTDKEADCLAIKNDWQAVGKDMEYTIKSYGKQLTSR